MANGNFAGGDGSKDNPFLIEDAFDLNSVRNGLDKHYKLIKDIDLDIAPFNEGEGWIPIGDNTHMFRGVLNGNGRTIYNLYINNPSASHCGLFGCINYINTMIDNIFDLTLSDFKVIGNYYVGSICGKCNQLTLLKNVCSINGIVNGRSEVGGLVGTSSSGGLIKNSYSSNVEVTGSGERIGGFVGYNISVIQNCYSMNKVIGLTGSTNIGGLVGLKYRSNNYTANAINSYYDAKKKNSSDGGIGKTTEELKTASTYIDWDKEKLEDGSPVWILKDGEYPKLWFEKSPYKYLLESNNTYYSIENNNLVLLENQNITRDTFKKYGFDNFEVLRNIDKAEYRLIIYNELQEEKILKLKYVLNKVETPINDLKKLNNGCFNFCLKEVRSGSSKYFKVNNIKGIW